VFLRSRKLAKVQKRNIHLHLGGKVIRTTADHPLYVEGKGRVNAGNMPGAKVEGEQDNLGEPTVPQFPIMGFTGDTPILTSTGFKSIEAINPGGMIH
jgi:hypothetical protein